jgi:hypothetical protein
MEVETLELFTNKAKKPAGDPLDSVDVPYNLIVNQSLTDKYIDPF